MMSSSRVHILVLFIVNITLICRATPAVTEKSIEDTGIILECDFNTVYHTISENLIGFNMTYSFCTDNFWKDTDIKPALKNMKTGFIRYPDGEPTSYYHWNNLNGQGYMDNWDPTYNRQNDQDTKNYTDLDEYIAICRETGVKPLVGINMESGLLFGRVQDGIDEAKALVKYCLDNNYGVVNFFLDNEPNHSNSHYVMTVDEYIEQIKLYAPELKKIDSNIKLIVNWDASLSNNKFWELLTQTHDLIDYVDVHWYWSWGNATFEKWCNLKPMTVDNDWYKPGRTYKEEIEYFNTQAKIKGVSNVKLISLEWNVGPSENNDISPNAFQCALIQSEMLMQFMDGNMDMAALWAFFWITKNTTPQFINRYLMNYYDNFRLLPCYDMFTLLAGALNKQKCKVSCSTDAVYPLAVKNEENTEKVVFMMHKGSSESYVNIKAPKGEGFSLKIFSSDAENPSVGSVKNAPCIYDEITQSYQFIIPAFSLAKLSINNSKSSGIYVSTSGNDENSGYSPADAVRSIKKAVEIAVAGDTVHVLAGIYTETHILLDQNITLIGENAATTIVQASETKPDGTSLLKDKNIFYLGNTASANIKSLTIRYGYNSEAGGAISVFNNQSLTLQACNIVENYTLIGGGAIANWGNLILEDCYISGNTATTNGGALLALGGSVDITNSVICNNLAYGTSNTNNSGAGACYVGASKVRLYNNTVAYNSCANAANKNFGIRIEGVTGTEFEIYNNIFCNSASNTWATGVDISLNNTVYAPVEAKNKNNIFTFVYTAVLNSSTIPQTTTDPKPTPSQIALGTLSQGNNGVYYLPILESSIAKDAGDVTTAISTDMFGVLRGDTPDVGSIEYIQNTPTQVIFANPEVFKCVVMKNGTLNFINFTGKGGKLEVYNLSGEKIYLCNVNAGITTMQLPDRTTGVLMLLFFSNEGVYSSKLLVK